MQKNIISPSTCKAELLRVLKADLFSHLALFAAVLTFFVPLILLGICVLKIIVPLGVIAIAAFSALPIYFIYQVIKAGISLHTAMRDGFSVVTDTVCRLAKGELEGRNRATDVIYFSKYGRYVAQGITFELASVGDKFYLVIPHKREKEPVLVFHASFYEYVEN